MFILLFILTSHLGGGPCKRGTASATRESSAEASITRATGGLKIQASPTTEFSGTGLQPHSRYLIQIEMI